MESDSSILRCIPHNESAVFEISHMTFDEQRKNTSAFAHGQVNIFDLADKTRPSTIILSLLRECVNYGH